MTPEVERKRRELFEETLSSKYSPAIGWHERGGKGYLLPCIQDQWIGFNAALDTVCIELPDVRAATDIAYFNADVIDAITATGLGLRVK